MCNFPMTPYVRRLDVLSVIVSQKALLFYSAFLNMVQRNFVPFHRGIGGKFGKMLYFRCDRLKLKGTD